MTITTHDFRDLALLVACLAAQASPAQVADSLQLPPATVEAARGSVTELTAPFAVSSLNRTEKELALNPELTLETTLAELPGISVSDRGHLVLGERLSIRGMGARAAFGVRGVQVLLDGIPLTMPDGQSITDIVDPALIRRAELIRGPSSVYWGNGSGGALFIEATPDASDHATARIQALGGGYGVHRFAVETAVPAGEHRVSAFASTFGQDGYREYSAGRITRTGLSAVFNLSSRTNLDVIAAGAFLDTNHPGSLTETAVETNPRSANPSFVSTQAGKESSQLQLGATLQHAISQGIVTATAYGVLRDLDNPLPFAYIDLNRLAGGLRLSLQQESGSLLWGVGADAAIQHDDRLNWNNDGGMPGDELALDQIETVTDAAVSGFATYSISNRLAFTGGLRTDLVTFSMDDRLLTDGNQSGDRDFLSWTPSIGVSYQLDHAVVFANYGTSFETPTTTELVNSPDGSAGFNPDLEPQQAHGIEAGIRGDFSDARLSVDAALFYMRVIDRLVPFQTEDGGDRTFYRNGGESEHAGVEAVLGWRPVPSIRTRITYTYTYLRYLDELSGNRVPGVPPHRLYAAVTFTKDEFFSEVSTRIESGYFADDANTARNDGHAVIDVAAGYEGLSVGSVAIDPFVQITNLTDLTYSGSVQVNAFGGRYYEPSPGRAVRAGLTVRFSSRPEKHRSTQSHRP